MRGAVSDDRPYRDPIFHSFSAAGRSQGACPIRVAASGGRGCEMLVANERESRRMARRYSSFTTTTFTVA
ncbi:MAG: hypothetical protein U0Q18_37690, partial [Bryobacteraceae bacterium]